MTTIKLILQFRIFIVFRNYWCVYNGWENTSHFLNQLIYMYKKKFKSYKIIDVIDSKKIIILNKHNNIYLLYLIFFSNNFILTLTSNREGIYIYTYICIIKTNKISHRILTY